MAKHLGPTIPVAEFRRLLERLPDDALLEPNDIGGVAVWSADGERALAFIDLVARRVDREDGPSPRLELS